MRNSAIKQLAAKVPTIPVGNSEREAFQRWHEAHRTCLMVLYQKHVWTYGECADSYDGFSEGMFLHGRDMVEPILN